MRQRSFQDFFILYYIFHLGVRQEDSRLPSFDLECPVDKGCTGSQND